VAAAKWSWPGIVRYLDQDLWRGDPSEGGRVRRLGLRLLRLAVVIVRAGQDKELNLRAMGLVYSTLLSLVPLLAVSFSVLKAFGAHELIRPTLTEALAPLGGRSAEITTRIVQFVDNVDVGVLGAMGVAGLLYTVLLLLDKIEDGLNAIWHARRGRSLIRKFSDYLSLLLVGPVLVFAALGMMAGMQSHWLVRWLFGIGGLETVGVLLAGRLAPFLFLAAAFAFLYAVVPNTQVRFRSALAGGAVAAVLWELAGLAFTAFIASSTRYTAIYSSFAVLVVFLVWVYVGWLVVLVGAQVAYFYQYPSSYLAARQRYGATFRERVALAALVEVSRRTLARRRLPQAEGIAGAIGAPVKIVEELIDDFVARGLLLRAAEPEGVALARGADDVTVADVLAVVKDPEGSPADTLRLPDAVADVLRRRERAVQEALDGVTLQTLAGESPGEAGVMSLARHRQR
jgi:membrane protein